MQTNYIERYRERPKLFANTNNLNYMFTMVSRKKKLSSTQLIDVLSLFCHSSKSMANHFSLLLLQVTTIMSHSYPTTYSPLQIIASSLNQLMHAAQEIRSLALDTNFHI